MYFPEANMAETVRVNRAFTLRSRIPRPSNQRPDLWAYTSPCPAPFPAPPKSRSPGFRDLPETPLGHQSLPMVPSPSSRIPRWGPQERKTDPETSSNHRTRSVSCTSMRARSTGQNTVMGKNWAQALEAERKKLEQMQSAFMDKLRLLASQGHNLPGVYKFLVLALNDEPKQALQEGDSKNIPLASSNDEEVKRLTDELASRDLTITELKSKLLLNEELSCEQALRLAEMNSAQMEKEDNVKYLESELTSNINLYNQLCSRFQETNQNLEEATKQVEQYLEKITILEVELKTLSENHTSTLATLSDQEVKLTVATAEADFHSQAAAQLRRDMDRLIEQLDLNQQVLISRADTIVKLQQSERNFREKFEDIFKQVGEKNTLINQLNNELEAKEEQFHNVMDTLKEKQGALRRQENIIRLMEEQSARSALMKAKQEERNSNMQMEIAQLKLNLQNQAHVMLLNDRIHLFGNIQADNAQIIQQQPPSRSQAQEQQQLQ